jgi:hypothetical protein
VTKYPVLFTYVEKVEGRGFLAEVIVDGRALLVDEGDNVWWMYGVNPGAIAEGGASQAEARIAMRETFKTVLFDMAAEAVSFEAFRVAVERFFNDTDQKSVGEWEAAVAAVRAGQVVTPGLPTQPASSPRGVHVEHKQNFAPSGNVLESRAALAA